MNNYIPNTHVNAISYPDYCKCACEKDSERESGKRANICSRRQNRDTGE